MKYAKEDVDFSRMNQLSDVLGLTGPEVGEVHTGLGSMAFEQQVQQVWAPISCSDSLGLKHLGLS